MSFLINGLVSFFAVFILVNQGHAGELGTESCQQYNAHRNFQKVQVCLDSSLSEPGSLGKVRIIGLDGELELDAELVEVEEREFSRGLTCNRLSYANNVLVLGVDDLDQISSFGIPQYLEPDQSLCADRQSLQFVEKTVTSIGANHEY